MEVLATYVRINTYSGETVKGPSKLLLSLNRSPGEYIKSKKTCKLPEL